LSDLRPNIWRLQAQFDTQGLIEALKNDDAGIRKRAAAALRTMGATEAIPTLQQLLKVEQNSDVRHAITAALDHLLPEQSEKVPALIAQLQSSQPEAVIYAARALGEIKDKTAVEALVLVFHNPQLPGRVRLAAAEALIKLESAPAVVTLLAALRSADWRIRRNAAAVLGQLRADWAIDSLVSSLGDENEVVGRTARAAIRRIGTPEALEALAAVDGEEIILHKAQTAKLPTTQPLQEPAETPKTEMNTTLSPSPVEASPTSEKSTSPEEVDRQAASQSAAVSTPPSEALKPQTELPQPNDPV
jgi:HEAT repeat protein